MAENRQKKANSKAEEALPHIEFQHGEEDPISELVRQRLALLLETGEEPDDAPHVPGEAHPGAGAASSGQKAATMVANVAEQVVLKQVVQAMKQAGGCTCEHCISDAVALALNELTPQYIVAPKHDQLARMAEYESKYEAQITGAVVSACMKVTGRPRH